MRYNTLRILGTESPLDMSDREINVTGDAPAKKWFLLELWEEVRPYLLHILKDLIVSVLLRVGIWVFHLLGEWMPVGGWVDDFLNNIHAAGAVGSFAVFVGLSAWDIWKLGKSRRRERGE